MTLPSTRPSRPIDKGLRVLAFAARIVDQGELSAMNDDPMSHVTDLDFVGMLVGIINPARASSRPAAMQTALKAGIDMQWSAR